MSETPSAESDAHDWCAQAEWPKVPCLLTCKESAPHHHHNQQGTRWTNPSPACPGDARLTDAEWREFQSIPDQGYSHRAWIDARIAERLTRPIPSATTEEAPDARA